MTTRVLLDGDTVANPATSLIGPVPPNARVMVLLDSDTYYVIGWYGPPAQAFPTVTGQGAGLLQPGTLSLSDGELASPAPLCGVTFLAPPSGQGTLLLQSRTVGVRVSARVCFGEVIGQGETALPPSFEDCPDSGGSRGGTCRG